MSNKVLHFVLPLFLVASALLLSCCAHPDEQNESAADALGISKTEDITGSDEVSERNSEISEMLEAMVANGEPFLAGFKKIVEEKGAVSLGDLTDAENISLACSPTVSWHSCINHDVVPAYSSWLEQVTSVSAPNIKLLEAIRTGELYRGRIFCISSTIKVGKKEFIVRSFVEPEQRRELLERFDAIMAGTSEETYEELFEDFKYTSEVFKIFDPSTYEDMYDEDMYYNEEAEYIIEALNKADDEISRPFW